jgi:hypothetical protein
VLEGFAAGIGFFTAGEDALVVTGFFDGVVELDAAVGFVVEIDFFTGVLVAAGFLAP